MTEASRSLLVRRFSVKRVDDGQSERVLDSVANEEPLEMHVNYWFKGAQRSDNLAIAMRTPGHDAELMAGFLATEGVIRSPEDLMELRQIGGDASNEIVAELASNVDFEAWRFKRNAVLSSSCGVCGKRTRESIAGQVPQPLSGTLRMSRSFITRLPQLLRDRQEGFAKTGGLHAAALVNRSGAIEALFEDIGRHNALDKLVGHCLVTGRIPLENHLLFLSSRSSFELIHKAVMAGAPILATIGGPSSLAIETAREHSLTLIGFIREQYFNIYSGEWRINS